MKGKKEIRRRNEFALALRDPRYGQRVVRNKKGYTRKGRNKNSRHQTSEA